MATVVLITAITPTFTSRPPSVAAFRIASATSVGSINGGGISVLYPYNFGMLRVRRVHGSRLNQGNRHRRLIHLLDLHTQCIRKSFNCVFGCRIHTLQRHYGFGHFAANINECSALYFKIGQRSKGAIYYAPEVGIKQTLAVRLTHFIQTAIDRNAGIIDPGIDMTETTDRFLGYKSILSRLATSATTWVTFPPALIISFSKA